MSNIWSDLLFRSIKSSTNTAQTIAGSLGYNWVNHQNLVGDVKFVSKAASKSVIARVAQQTILQMAEAEINKFYPRFKREMEKKMRNSVLKQTEGNDYHVLFRDGRDTTDRHGQYKTPEGDLVFAMDYFNRKVPEALIMSYAGKESITYTFPTAVIADYYEKNEKNKYETLLNFRDSYTHHKEYDILKNGESPSKSREVVTKDIIHIDVNPQISFSTDKNLILTQVQGRDFTRKELISNGDFNFSVKGSVVSHQPGVYPTEAVKRLTKIAQYKGVVDVRHYIFDQFNVKQVIIKDFSLDAQEYLNIQPYSFTCVAIETDDLKLKTEDTIGKINEDLQLSPINSWYKYVLDSKLADIVVNNVTTATNSVVAKGLDLGGLISNNI